MLHFLKGVSIFLRFVWLFLGWVFFFFFFFLGGGVASTVAKSLDVRQVVPGFLFDVGSKPKCC